MSNSIILAIVYLDSKLADQARKGSLVNIKTSYFPSAFKLRHKAMSTVH